MVFHSQVPARYTCRLLAIPSGSVHEDKSKKDNPDDQLRYPFPKLTSSGRLEVQVLQNPNKDEFCRILESYKPNIVYLQGEQLENEEVGSLAWGGLDLSTVEAISGLFSSPLPSTVYLDIANGEEVADVLHSKGIPYVIYWRNTLSYYGACHFRNAFLSVLQSSSAHTWDAFRLAHASFRVYCLGNKLVLPKNSHEVCEDHEPHILGECLKINVEPLEKEAADDEKHSLETLSSISLHDNDVEVRFLMCGEPCSLDGFSLGALKDGLNALLDIEIRGSKLHGKFGAPPPPLQAGTLSHGVVTMRCDISTCSFAHISLLVSATAQACFHDQVLENLIKNEIIEKGSLVHKLIDDYGNKHLLAELRKSASIACGAPVFEVSFKVPSWASQILRQLAPDVSCRSLVGLGIASIQGLPVASFEKDDAERLLFFCSRTEKEIFLNNITDSPLPSWLKPPPPTKRSERMKDASWLGSPDFFETPKASSLCSVDDEKIKTGSMNGFKTSILPRRRRMKIAAMRPIPRVNRHKMTPFPGIAEIGGHNGGLVKAGVPSISPTKHVAVGSTSFSLQKLFPSASHSKRIIPLNPLPLKKHGCGRSSIRACFEEEFLKDLMQFLALRGHNRLIPQGGLTEFPDAILNGKRLDLYNLYKEVVSRGGFLVGNGINWKGQIFYKMRNYTMTNRMTGVGNTLKRHYETYLLEYELAHDDVDGECCLLCRSSAAGDWVNCGICGEWAHFGCDRRQGLGAFKDYAKTDGLEYICPHCSLTTFKKKKLTKGLSQGLSSKPM